MSRIKDAKGYISTFGLGTFAARLARGGAQHARHRIGSARGVRPTFEYDGRTLEQLWHPYNRTWMNERALEIPITQHFLERFDCEARGLEVGNVMSHYQPINHRVVDKYEVAPGVENIDVIDIVTSDPYDYILAISTLEHVGWDEPIRDMTKVSKAIEHLRSLLKPDGVFLVTLPLGYNPAVDTFVFGGQTQALHEEIYVLDHRDRWRPTPRPEPFQVRYLWELRSAGIIWCAELPASVAPDRREAPPN